MLVQDIDSTTLNRLHLVLLICINALWGFNFIAAKLGTAVFGPFLFITIRFTIVFILLAFFLRWVPGQMYRILGIGVCMGVGHYAFMFYGVYLAGSLSSVAIASQLTVPFATLLAILFLKERIGITRILAIAASFLGVVIIGFEPFGVEHLVALAYTTIASLAMATATVSMRQLKNVAVFNLQAWIAIVSCLSMAVITWCIQPPKMSHISSIAVADYWTILFSAIGATILGHGSLYYLLQRYPVINIAPFITLSTLFAIVFGILFLNEQLTFKIAVGGILTLLGVTVIAMRDVKT